MIPPCEKSGTNEADMILFVPLAAGSAPGDSIRKCLDSQITTFPFLSAAFLFRENFCQNFPGRRLGEEREDDQAENGNC